MLQTRSVISHNLSIIRFSPEYKSSCKWTKFRRYACLALISLCVCSSLMSLFLPSTSPSLSAVYSSFSRSWSDGSITIPHTQKCAKWSRISWPCKKKERKRKTLNFTLLSLPGCRSLLSSVVNSDTCNLSFWTAAELWNDSLNSVLNNTGG